MENAGNYTIDIRNQASDGSASIKGIELSSSQYNIVVRELSEALWPMLLHLITYPSECTEMDYSMHIGNLIYISIKSPWKCINIRERYAKATGGIGFSLNNGISLKIRSVERLMDLNRSIQKCFPKIAETIPCKYTHPDLDTAIQCNVCYPGITNVISSVTENYA